MGIRLQERGHQAATGDTGKQSTEKMEDHKAGAGSASAHDVGVACRAPAVGVGVHRHVQARVPSLATFHLGVGTGFCTEPEACQFKQPACCSYLHASCQSSKFTEQRFHSSGLRGWLGGWRDCLASMGT